MADGMAFDQLRDLGQGLEQVEALYEHFFDEATRLDSQAQQIEFVTTCLAVEAALPPGGRILDLGAGTGRYSHYFAARGFDVHAVEPVGKHVARINAGKQEGMCLKVQAGDALSVLPGLPQGHYDAVLCLGPLYHLHAHQDRVACLQGCARVSRPQGRVWAAFINADFVITTQTMCYDGGDYMVSGAFDKQTFQVEDFPFKFDRLEQAEALVEAAGLPLYTRIASDGLSELFGRQIDAMTPAQYQQWLKYHLYTSRKAAFLGASNHWLFELGAGA